MVFFIAYAKPRELMPIRLHEDKKNNLRCFGGSVGSGSGRRLSPLVTPSIVVRRENYNNNDDGDGDWWC